MSRPWQQHLDGAALVCSWPQVPLSPAAGRATSARTEGSNRYPSLPHAVPMRTATTNVSNNDAGLPNVLALLTDDQRYDTVHALGQNFSWQSRHRSEPEYPAAAARDGGDIMGPANQPPIPASSCHAWCRRRVDHCNCYPST
jgi:hypothetical protein